MESTKIEINTEDAILSVENRKLDQFHKAYFGSYFGNVLEAYLDNYNNLHNLTLVSLEEATLGTPEIQFAEQVEEMDAVPVSDEYGDAFQFDFDFYFNKDSVYMVNTKVKGKPVNQVCKESRVEYGLSDYEIVYIKVKDLTKDEMDQLINGIQNRDIEIENLGENKNEPVTKMIEKIEEKEGISIVQASIIGSKGWKYEDKDSDIDLRFVYVKKPEDYISISKQEDNITYPIDNKEDVVGYDLGKMLKMICTQNPMAYEIINSPVQIQDNEVLQQLKQFSDKVLQPSKLISTYQHMVETRISELQNKKTDNIKLYIYILRMLGTIYYLQRNQKYPICDLKALFSDESNKHLQSLIQQLVDYKQSGVKTINITPEIIEHLKRELEKTKGVEMPSTSYPPEEMEQEANAIFYNTVQAYKDKKKKEEMESFFQESKGIDTETQARR